MSNRPKILITGASGFLGRPLVASLSARADIIPAILDGRRADLLNRDDRAALIKGSPADILIHLAWFTEHGKFWGADANQAWQDASIDLFARFYASGGQRIVGIGSCAEYDWTTGAERFFESDPIAPHTEYGAAKARTSDELATLAAQHSASWAWGRVFFSFGPAEPTGRLIPLILNAVRERQTLGIGPGDTVRDFCAVDHVGRALSALSLSAVQGPVNLGGGHEIRFSELARIANALAGGTTVVETDRRALGTGEPRILVADTARLRTEVGFVPPDQLSSDLADYYRTDFAPVG